MLLIIYAHPNKKGHSGYFLKTIQTTINKRNIKYEILDLYKMNYDPILKNEEHYTFGHKIISKENLEIQEKIKIASALIFIYPIWWQNVPAILKGFFDRVFTSGFSFRFKGVFPIGLLKGKKAVIFTNSAGPTIFTRFFTGYRGVKVIAKDVLQFCGIKTRSYLVGSAKNLNQKQQQKIIKLVNKGLNFLS